MNNRSENSLLVKYEELKHALRSFGKVGVAFSGGIDSSLLLLAAVETLGRDKVIALHGRSALNIYETEIEDFFKRYYGSNAKLRIIDLQPLNWSDFVNNDGKRCYYCKRKTYSQFLSEIANDDAVLIDGTNKDDLKESRAGLAVLTELGVRTPLADVGLSKKEIRFLARSFGLPNHNTPSNSCLATRLQTNVKIGAENLSTVMMIEKKLHQLGFHGCRVRPIDESVTIELREQDILRFTRKNNRIDIIQFCKTFRFEKILLDIKGR